jgi:hypothetical protein
MSAFIYCDGLPDTLHTAIGIRKNSTCPVCAVLAELTRKKSLLQRFMDEQDTDWWQECGDYKNGELFDTVVPIGLIRDIAEELKK